MEKELKVIVIWKGLLWLWNSVYVIDERLLSIYLKIYIVSGYIFSIGLV